MSEIRLAMLAAFGGNFIFGFSFLFTKKVLEVNTSSVMIAAVLIIFGIAGVQYFVPKKPLKN